MNEVTPTATGTLDATPLPHLLVYALDRSLTGTLVIETPNQARSAIYFEEGAPARVRTAEPVIHLGRLLLELGAIDEDTLNRSLLEVAQHRRLHGQVLIRDRVIDEVTLHEALKEQVARQVLWMFSLPSASAYGYYDRLNFLERWGGPEQVRVQPLQLLWRGVRAHTAQPLVDALIARIGAHPLKLHPAGRIAKFRFAPNEQSVIDVLRAKPHRYDELAATQLCEEQLLRRLVYALAITRHLEFGSSDAVPVGLSEPPSSARISVTPPPRKASAPGAPAAPASRAAIPQAGGPVRRPSSQAAVKAAKAGVADPAFVEEIKKRAELLAKQNYYELLGVPKEAPTGAIQLAFFQLAKRWHPDRVGPEYASVKELATRVFSRMSEAHHVLTDDKVRAEYDQLLKSGGGSAGEQEEVQTVLRAVTAFQKAEVLLKKNNLAEAEEHAKIAAESDPDQADYVALHAWIQSLKPEREGAPLDDLIKILANAVTKEPENLRVRWYRGQLLKRAGKPEQAVRDFRFIVERNPKHLDAMREIRLYEMRKTGGRATPSKRPSMPAPRSTTRPPAAESSRPKQNESLMNTDVGTLLNKWFKR